MCFLLLGGFVKPALRAARCCFLSLHFQCVHAGLEIPAVGLHAGSGMGTPPAFQSQMFAVLRSEDAYVVIGPKAEMQELPLQMNL